MGYKHLALLSASDLASISAWSSIYWCWSPTSSPSSFISSGTRISKSFLGCGSPAKPRFNWSLGSCYNDTNKMVNVILSYLSFNIKSLFTCICI